MKINKRRRKFMGTLFERHLLVLLFCAAVIPAVIVGICLYYLIFHYLSWQIGIPEAIAFNVIPVAQKVSMVIFISLPVLLIILWFVSLELSHRIAGPLDRLERELEARVAGHKTGPIRVRKGDELFSLVERINTLMCKPQANTAKE